jgi:hypothetical protein
MEDLLSAQELDWLENICSAVHDRDWRLAQSQDQQERVYLEERHEYHGEDDGSVCEVSPSRPEANEIRRFIAAFDPRMVQYLIEQARRGLQK